MTDVLIPTSARALEPAPAALTDTAARVRDLLRQQTVRYLLVGAACTAVDIGLFNLFTFPLSINPAISKVLAGAIAIVVSFGLNRTWTFSGADSAEMKRQFALYVVINVISAGISVACLSAAAHLQLTGLVWTNVAAFSVVLVLGTVVRFLVYRRWVFRSRR